MTEEITNELRQLIEPRLREMLPEDSYEYIDEMFSEVVYSAPDGVLRVSLKPIGDAPSFQFSTVTGEFLEITDWEYIQSVDLDAQLAEQEQQDNVEATITALKHYHKQEYQTITDYEKVVNDRRALTYDGVSFYEYVLPGQVIYLKEDNYPITYKNQLVSDGWYYYTDDSTADGESLDRYTYKVKYEWKRTSIWG